MANASQSIVTLHAVDTMNSDASHPRGTDQRSLRLRLTTLLHSSLDIEEVLKLFFTETVCELGMDGLAYEHHQHGLSLIVADGGNHRCHYRLEHLQTDLGELQLSRGKRFNERELARLELMIACLLPALRNALQYHAAVQSAVRDPLTRLGNRNALELAAGHEIALARRHRQTCSMLVIDLDHFKDINDNHGHGAGDEVLMAVARQLRSNCRETDAMFRLGGEEFLVLLSGIDLDGALRIGERVRAAIEAMPVTYSGKNIAVTASVGVASLCAEETLQEWFDRADQALYRAKRDGRNRVASATVGRHPPALLADQVG